MSGKGHDASIVVFENYCAVFASYTCGVEHDPIIIEKLKHDYGDK
jgi:hypothetical protein